jgi:hypothetical protein
MVGCRTEARIREGPTKRSEEMDTIWLVPRDDKSASSMLMSERYQRRPNAKLALRIEGRGDGERRNWGDGSAKRLEDHLNAFVAALIGEAERLRLRRIEAERREREWQKEKRRHEEAERARQLKAQLVADLDGRVADWYRAREIRAFAAAVEEDARKGEAEWDPESYVARWLAWARRRADALEEAAVRTIGHARSATT